MNLRRLLSFVCFVYFVVTLSGCASFDAQLPDGKATNFRYVRSGKFSSTTIEAKDFEKTATHVKASTWVVKHSNAWVPNIEITAEGYERVLAPSTSK